MAIMSTVNVKKKKIESSSKNVWDWHQIISFIWLLIIVPLGVFRYRHIIKLHFICPVLIIFFMVVKYVIDCWSSACFLMYLSSHHSYEEIKYTHNHLAGWELTHRKEKQLDEGPIHGRARTGKKNMTLHFRDLFIVLYWNLRSFHNHTLPGGETIWQNKNYNKKSPESLIIYSML